AADLAEGGGHDDVAQELVDRRTNRDEASRLARLEAVCAVGPADEGRLVEPARITRGEARVDRRLTARRGCWLRGGERCGGPGCERRGDWRLRCGRGGTRWSRYVHDLRWSWGRGERWRTTLGGWCDRCLVGSNR